MLFRLLPHRAHGGHQSDRSLAILTAWLGLALGPRLLALGHAPFASFALRRCLQLLRLACVGGFAVSVRWPPVSFGSSFSSFPPALACVCLRLWLWEGKVFACRSLFPAASFGSGLWAQACCLVSRSGSGCARMLAFAFCIGLCSFFWLRPGLKSLCCLLSRSLAGFVWFWRCVLQPPLQLLLARALSSSLLSSAQPSFGWHCLVLALRAATAFAASFGSGPGL